MRTFKISLLVFILSITISAQNYWQPTSGPYGGSTTSLCADSNGKVYAISAPSGMNTVITPALYRTTDDGNMWEKIDTAMQGSKPITVFVDSLNNLFVGCNNGLFRSTNSGDDWIRIDSTHSFSMLTSGHNGSLFGGNLSNLFRSTDFGISWQTLTLPDYLVSIVVNTNGDIFIIGWNGVYRSSDNGTSWQLTLPLSDTFNDGITHNSMGKVFVATPHGLFRSTDNGENWLTLNTYPVTDHYWKSIWIDNEDNIFVGAFVNGVLIKSSDDGETWQQIDNSNWTGSYAIWSITSNSSYVFVGNVDGIYRSEDLGSNWIRSCSGIKEVPIISLTHNKSDLIFAGSWGSGVFRTSDNGLNWTVVSTGLTNSNALTLAVDSSQNIYVGTPGGGVFRSTNNGDLWLQINGNSVNPLPSNPNVQKLIVDEHDNLYAGVASFTIYRSSDYGQNWISTNYPGQFNDHQLLTSMGALFAGNGLFYKSINQGEQWTETLSIPYGYNSRLAQSSSNIWAICSRVGVYESKDTGTTWIKMNSGFSNYYSFTVAADSQSHLFAGGDSGVYRSTDEGANWTVVNSGLSSLYIRTLMATPDGYVYVGAGRGGVLRTVSSTTSVHFNLHTLPLHFELYQNYPNPFNPLTKIKYSVPASEIVHLKIFDILGREIATLVNEEKPAGTYEVKFDGSNFTSGVYFYRLQVGSFSETKKFILQR